MPDREMIVKWFEFCRVEDKCSTDCPYWDNKGGALECTKKLAKDVLTLLNGDFIGKHWSSTLVRSTEYERENDSGEPDEVHRPGADRAPAVHPGRERREGQLDRAQALFKES